MILNVYMVHLFINDNAALLKSEKKLTAHTWCTIYSLV